jgi:acyl transferase domain-containing protein/acyl carrier protein
VAAKARATAPVILEVDAAALEQENRIAAADTRGSRTLVGCGRAVGDAVFRIVDAETGRPMPEGRVGELWISDPCVAPGYWQNPEASRETFGAFLAEPAAGPEAGPEPGPEGDEEALLGPFLRTGDLAFLRDGELFIAGRLKDLIILRGRNLYPQDLELAAEGADRRLRAGCGAAFAVEQEGEERLVIAHEVQAGLSPQAAPEVAAEVRQAVAESHDAEVWSVVLLEPGALPKTSSGKIQRRECARSYLEGSLAVVSEHRSPAALAISEPSLAVSLAAEGPSQRQVEAWLARRLAAELGVEAATVDPDQPFARFGLGSASMVGLAAELERWLGRRLPETLLYEHPTLRRLSQALAADGEAAAPRSSQTAWRQPIAIVGLACRFPGAPDPEAFWKLLSQGVDAVAEVPPERWDVERFYAADPLTPGKMNTRWGGFLDRVEEFDPYFFGISPREAERMDPQQRLLLELAWEALEDAGLPAANLAGTDTGVFVGIGLSDYGRWLLADPQQSDAYAGTGGALSIAANRLSYVFDFLGPSMAIDTACSSSLVAVLQACRSLWAGESSLALAGGSNLLLSPEVTVNFSKAGFMAPDGRCKPFDARADGYVRGEGAGLVVLKPLAQAQADGDRIYALIRGGAVNQDGRSNGLTAPSPLAQEAMVRLALEDAGAQPGDIAYVEAHGTGTALGDPIEARALGHALNQEPSPGPGQSPRRTCRLGSVKSNLGHLEAAAGVASLIKVALCLQHRSWVPSLHFESPNPRIPFAELGLEVQTRVEPWDASERPLAGISSFGFGGTNAHLILEAAPAEAGTADLSPADASGEAYSGEAQADEAYLLPLSAHSPEALEQRARDLAHWLSHWQTQEPQVSLEDLSRTLACRRSPLEHRLSLVASSAEALRQALSVYPEALDGVPLSRGRKRPHRPKVAFVLPGQGSQWPAMGLELYRGEAVFRRRFEEVAAALEPHLDWSPLAELEALGERSRLHEIDVVQPLTFLLQVSLASLWRSWGVEPEMVIGHSLGEVAAAAISGALSLEDAAKVICLRSRLMRRRSGDGGMLAVDLPPASLEEVLAPYAGRVSVAVENSRTACALSGDEAALAEIRRQLEERGVFCRNVQVDVAAHSPHMDPLQEEFGRGLEGLQPRAAAVPMVSTVTGQTLLGPELTVAYWQQNLRQPVRFLTAVQEAIRLGCDTFVELSGHPLLLTPMEQVAEDAGASIVAVGSLRREEPQGPALRNSLGRLFVSGQSVAWHRLYRRAAPPLDLPLYPWQRERFWLERPAAATASPGPEERRHPLLARGLALARGGEEVWEGELGAVAAQLRDHRVHGSMVLPGASFLDIALSAAGVPEVTQMELERALFVAESDLEREHPVRLQTSLFMDDRGRRRFEIHSHSEGDGWQRHARGCLAQAWEGTEDAAPALELEALQGRLSVQLEGEEYYRLLAAAGYGYGPLHQGLKRLWRGFGEVLAELDPAAAGASQEHRYSPAAATLDAAWQSLGTLGEEIGAELWLPVAVDSHRLFAGSGPARWVHARQKPAERADRLVAEVSLFDAEGRPVAQTRGLRLQKLARRAAAPLVRDWLYQESWRQKALRPRAEAKPGTWLILGDDGGFGEAVEVYLAAAGQRTVLTHATADFQPGDAAALRRWLRSVGAADLPPVRGIVYGWALDASEEDPTSARNLALTTTTPVDLLRELTLGAGEEPPQLWLLSRQALEVRAGDSPVHPTLGLLRGLGRVMAQEQPDLYGAFLDLGADAEPMEVASALVAEMLGGAGEPEVAFRDGRRFVPRLQRAPVPEPAPPLRPDASYLVTGGSGGLGRAVARWLVSRGAVHLVLLGRRTAEAELCQELASLGARPTSVAVDVGDAAGLESALEDLSRQGLPAIAGILHCAGVVEDCSLLELDEGRFRRVLRPKLDGAWNLHRWSQHRELDFFVLFSSAAFTLGNPGQANYAAANGFLAALADRRQQQGLPASAIHWGLWREIGFAAQSPAGEAVRQRLESQGLDTLAPATGLEILGRLLTAGPQTLALPADWHRLRASGSPLAEAPLLVELVPAAVPSEPTAEIWDALALAEASEEERRQALEALLRSKIGKVLRMPAQRLPLDEPLTALGLDSLVAVEVRNALATTLDQSVPLAWLLQGASVRSLAQRLSQRLSERISGRPPEREPESPPRGVPELPAAARADTWDSQELPDADEARLLLERLDELPPEQVDQLLASLEAQAEVVN